jgi:hypothetical protein
LDLIEKQLEKIKDEIDKLKIWLLIILFFCVSTWTLIILKTLTEVMPNEWYDYHNDPMPLPSNPSVGAAHPPDNTQTNVFFSKPPL